MSKQLEEKPSKVRIHPQIRRKSDRSWINIAHTTDENDELLPEDVDDLDEIQDFFITESQRRILMEEEEEDEDEDEEEYTQESKPKRQKKSAVSSDASKKRVSDVSAAMPIEWYTFHINGLAVGFDLEMWWRRSKAFLRLHSILIVFLFIFSLMHLCAGVWYIVFHCLQTIESPYVCRTKDCKHATYFFTQTMNTSEDACEDFYEFMCGNYKEAITSIQTAQLFSFLMSEPGYKLEMGESSLLAKILKDFKNDPKYDKTIRYYQSCLDDEAKKVHGIQALLNRIEYIFGNRDLCKFNEASEPSMEQVAIRMFEVVGHAYFLNIGFSTYPFIQYLNPKWGASYFQDYDDISFTYHYYNYTNEIYVRAVFNYLMPKLGIQKGSPEIEELVKGIGFWGDLIFTKLKPIIQTMDFFGPDGDARFFQYLKASLSRQCPPMGIKLDTRKVLNGFLQTTSWKEDYYDYSSKRYWQAINWCFHQDPPISNAPNSRDNAKLSPRMNRLSFASVWIFAIFQQVVEVMDEGFMETYANGINEEEWKGVRVAHHIWLYKRHIDLEYKCLLELWRSLGYLPSLRYLTQNVRNPIDFLTSNIDEIEELYEFTRRYFRRIPQSEIHPFMARQGELQLGRELHAEIIKPLNAKFIHSYSDLLEFTKDHLNNHFLALNWTIQVGRKQWLGSTDKHPFPKWWAYGGTIYNMKQRIFDVRLSFVDPAHFVMEQGAFTAGIWDQFLGRKEANYIVFPLTLYNEPHFDETLALKSAKVTLKTIRTILSIVGRVADDHFTYPPFMAGVPHKTAPQELRDEYFRRRKLMRTNGGNGYNEYPINETNKCTTFVINRPDVDQSHFYRFDMESHVVQSLSSNDYAEFVNFFLNVMALKLSYRHFDAERKRNREMPYSSKLPKEMRDFRIRRRLPGELAKYTEEQIFFMSVIRDTCFEGWDKTDDKDPTKKSRYKVSENVVNMLAQTEEFRRAFNCGGKTLMNNRGKPKCFKWVPG